jgi:hypothetical protein
MSSPLFYANSNDNCHNENGSKQQPQHGDSEQRKQQLLHVLRKDETKGNAGDSNNSVVVNVAIIEGASGKDIIKAALHDFLVRSNKRLLREKEEDEFITTIEAAGWKTDTGGVIVEDGRPRRIKFL